MSEKILEGWWSFTSQGTREGLAKAIAESDKIPADWKALLTSELSTIPVDYNVIKIAAHCHVEKAKKNVHISIHPDVFCFG